MEKVEHALFLAAYESEKAKRKRWYLRKMKQNQRGICHANVNADDPPEGYRRL